MRFGSMETVREIINGSRENCLDIIQQQSTTGVAITVAVDLDMTMEVRLVQALNQNLDSIINIIKQGAW